MNEKLKEKLIDIFANIFAYSIIGYIFIDYMLSKGLTPEELVVYMGYSSFKHMINYYRVASAKDKIIQKIKEAIWENY